MKVNKILLIILISIVIIISSIFIIKLFTKKCKTNTDCGDGKECNKNNKCVPSNTPKPDPNKCDPECGKDQVCKEGKCVDHKPEPKPDPNKCDPECGKDQLCKEGKCYDKYECTEKIHCLEDKICSKEGKCVDPPPKPGPKPEPKPDPNKCDPECNEDQVCVIDQNNGNKCYNKYECTEKIHCPEGKICVNNKCKTPPKPDPNKCDPECGKDQVCKEGKCVDPKPEPEPGCSENKNCPKGKSCKGGKCTSCSQDTDCLEGEICINGYCGKFNRNYAYVGTPLNETDQYTGDNPYDCETLCDKTDKCTRWFLEKTSDNKFKCKLYDTNSCSIKWDNSIASDNVSKFVKCSEGGACEIKYSLYDGSINGEKIKCNSKRDCISEKDLNYFIKYYPDIKNTSCGKKTVCGKYEDGKFIANNPKSVCLIDKDCNNGDVCASINETVCGSNDNGKFVPAYSTMTIGNNTRIVSDDAEKCKEKSECQKDGIASFTIDCVKEKEGEKSFCRNLLNVTRTKEGDETKDGIGKCKTDLDCFYSPDGNISSLGTEKAWKCDKETGYCKGPQLDMPYIASLSCSSVQKPNFPSQYGFYTPFKFLGGCKDKGEGEKCYITDYSDPPQNLTGKCVKDNDGLICYPEYLCRLNDNTTEENPVGTCTPANNIIPN